MSFYSDASLVLVPSGVKDSKVYSIKPTDGSGDLTFTRNSNATRVNADGLVEKVRTNNALNSENFTAWGLAGTPNPTVSGDTTLSPIGTLTADTVSFSAAATSAVQQTSGTSAANQTHTVSVWAKVASGTAKFRLKCTHAGVLDYYSADQTATTEWQRFSFTQSFGSGGTGFVYGVINEVAGGAKDVIFWGYQLEVGNDFGPTDYIPTTSAAVSVGPTANVPRLDYSGGCPSLLLEPQRTNLALYSEQLDNTGGWLVAAASVAANQTTSPDGYQNADELTVTNNAGGIYSNDIAVSSSTAYTFSFYAKQGTATQSYLAIRDQTNGAFIDVDIQYTATSTEWTRVTHTFTTPATCTSVRCYPQRYSSGGQGTHYFWGAQLEAGNYATSYIGPTLGASVTRLADAGNVNVSSLLTSTATYTWFVEFIVPKSGTGGGEITFKDTGGSIQLRIYCNQANTVGMRVDDGSQNFYINVSIGDTAKCLFQCTNGLVKGFYNGELVKTFIVDTGMNAQVIHLGPPVSAPNVKQMLLFNSALSDADCETLTAL